MIKNQSGHTGDTMKPLISDDMITEFARHTEGAIRQAIRATAEACAKICEENDVAGDSFTAAAAIRSRVTE